MKPFLRFFALMLPLTVNVACDDSDSEDKPARDNNNNNNSNSSNSNNNGSDSNAGGSNSSDEVVWSCFCEATCDGDVLQVEELVCSDDATIEFAVELAVEECAAELNEGCVEFDCFCDCEEDPQSQCS